VRGRRTWPLPLWEAGGRGEEEEEGQVASHQQASELCRQSDQPKSSLKD
jgi:hypothetical protein